MMMLVKRKYLLFKKAEKFLVNTLDREHTIHFLVSDSTTAAAIIHWSYYGDTRDCKVLHRQFVTYQELQEYWKPQRTRRTT